jgi:hypothetical protein
MKENLKNLVLIFSVVLNAVFLFATGFQSLSARISGDKPSENCPFLYQELNLSKEQLNRMEPVRDRFHARLSKTGGEIQARQLQLIDLLAAPDHDLKAVNALQEEIQGLQKTMQDTIIAHIREETGIFTPAQRDTFFKLIKDRTEQSGHACPPWMKPARGDAPMQPERAGK